MMKRWDYCSFLCGRFVLEAGCLEGLVGSLLHCLLSSVWGECKKGLRSMGVVAGEKRLCGFFFYQLPALVDDRTYRYAMLLYDR